MSGETAQAIQGLTDQLAAVHNEYGAKTAEINATKDLMVEAVDAKNLSLQEEVTTFKEVAEASIADSMGASGALKPFMTTGGQLSYFYGIPKFQIEDLYPDGSLGTGTHPAFITAAGEAKILWLSAYHLSYLNGEMVSQPGIMPAVSMTQDAEIARCEETVIAGQAGHRNASVWDIALMRSLTHAMVQGGMAEPARNDSYGKYSAVPSIRGHGASGITNGSMGSTATHNRQIDGIHNAFGGHWTRFQGAKTQDGEIFLAASNDPADIATPITTGHHYTTGSDAENSTMIDITTDAASVVRNGTVGDDSHGPYSYRPGAAGNASVGGSTTAMMKLAGLAPLGDGADMSGGIYTRNYGLRAFLAFGSWTHGSSAGPAALRSVTAPSHAYSHIATRSAFLEF